MELFLDSVDFQEIQAAFDWRILSGLTTTPTFMHRHGITDIDGAIVKLSGMVPELHVEALGKTAEETITEARRIMALPLAKPVVFKIPISNEGLKACKILTSEGHRVNIHLIYTLNQAYLAMAAGATYICPLVGRLHDQGHDAMTLIEQAVQTVNRYQYKTKVMVSSVRHAEHVRQAILAGAHAITIPWTVLKSLNNNTLTDAGVNQFFEHTRLMTQRVREVIRPDNPTCNRNSSILEAIVQMTGTGFGAVSVLDDDGFLAGVFTDGDLRRLVKENGKAALEQHLSSFTFNEPITINADALLYEAVNIFGRAQVDNLVVLENNEPIGMLDIQDFVKMGLVG